MFFSVRLLLPPALAASALALVEQAPVLVAVTLRVLLPVTHLLSVASRTRPTRTRSVPVSKKKTLFFLCLFLHDRFC